ncbi:DUF134 domain-containing protein [bacterium]|nr:DUF134 domain-containing protein [bacterium]
MPRHRRLRRVVAPPRFSGHKPYGVVKTATDCIELFYEQNEAFKLVDDDYMNHESATNIMGIYRPTFAKIYENTRRKITKAMVEVKEIKTTYGNAFMDKNWFVCNDCHARFFIPQKITRPIVLYAQNIIYNH